MALYGVENQDIFFVKRCRLLEIFFSELMCIVFNIQCQCSNKLPTRMGVS